jgi:ABC-type nitrate/sulfonate/bicarbonate transport system permease component
MPRRNRLLVKNSIGQSPFHRPNAVALRSRWRIRDFVMSLLPIICALVIWEICAFSSGSSFVPHLSALAVTIAESFPSDPIIAAQGGGANGYYPHILATLEVFLACVAVGSGTGFVISVIFSPWVSMRNLFSAALRPWHVIPPLIVIPLAFALLGPSRLSSYLGGTFYAFVSTSIIVVGALDQVPTNLIELARLAGARPLWIAWRVRAVSVLPMLVGPLKIVGSFTLGVVVILEYLAAPIGIGRVMKFAIAYNAVGLILTGVFWAALIGYGFSTGIDLLSRIFLRWSAKTRAAETPFSILAAERLANQ